MQAVGQAQAEAVAGMLESVRHAAARNWQAAAWFLERRFPEDFSRRESRRSEVSGRDGGPVALTWLNLVNESPGDGDGIES